METKAMTMQEAAQEAIACQNACNLSGVLRTFHEVVSDVLWPEAHKIGQGTVWVNTHPIVTVFLSKLADLNGKHTNWDGLAWDAVQQIAQE